MRTIKLPVWLTLILLLLAAPLVAAAPETDPAPIELAPFDPHILNVIDEEGQADFYVVLDEQADLSGAAGLPTKQAKGQYVFEALTRVAARTQGPLLLELTLQGATFQPFWIRNMVRVRGDKGLLLDMAARPGVAEIFYEYEPVLDVEPPELAQPAPEAIEWNIDRVDADLVWSMGITGTGAVVASLDTGADWDHPALVDSYREQIPGAPGRHDYNWWDGPNGYEVPTDYDDHGTHTIGTMVGDDGGANQVGMAPGADWIACAGLGSSATPMDCFQFFLAPTQLDGSNPRPDLAPHVINNSWSSASDYHAIIQVLYAAGIFYAKSAGNEGAGCATITNPGQWPEVTATASFAQGDNISGFSSRGPVQIGHDLVIKPDVAAPGSSVRSTLPGGGYGTKSGTSMASPHVAGAVGLLISANPDLAGQVDVLQMILKQTAEPMYDNQCPPYASGGIPNNVWGYGILDAEAAVLMAQALGFGGLEGQVYDSSDLAPIPGAAITMQDEASGWPLYDSSDAGGLYGRTLPTATYSLSATHYGYLPGVVPGVVVSAGMTTTQDIPLDPAPMWTVSGAVTETQTGDPLAAHVLFEETPVSTDTNPASGLYSADVAQGQWWMQVTSPGHAKAERLVTVTQDLVEDFSLPAIHNYYMRVGDGPCDPVFDWMDASGGTLRCMSDDSYLYVPLPSGRSFTFYGNTYTTLYLGSNGHVTFGTPNNKWSGPIPDPATPNNGVYAFSTDLNPASCSQGNIYTDYLDDRYFVIQFDQVEHYPSGDPETFEIVMDLDTGLVSVQFLTVTDASEAVVGVENATGTEATQYAYADPVLITDSVRVDFYPAFGTPPPLPQAGQIAGTVSDLETGQPIEAATVNALAFSDGRLFSYTTDITGTYAGLLCPDGYTMTASAPGYYPSAEVAVTVLSGTLTVQDFDLVQVTPPCTQTSGVSLTRLSPDPILPDDLVAFEADVGPDDAAKPYTYTAHYGDGTAEVGVSAADPLSLSHAYTQTGRYPVEVWVWNCTMTVPATDGLTVEVVVPDVEVTVPAPAEPVLPGERYTRSLNVANVGGADLSWSLSEVSPVEWLSEEPTSGSLAPLTDVDVVLTFDATGLAAGEYDAILRLDTDDPSEPFTYVPVTMTVYEACTQISDLELSLVTTGSLDPGDTAEFEADVSPDDATTPYTYTIDYGDGTAPVEGASSVDPLASSHVYTQAGAYQVEVWAWNCDVTAPVSDGLSLVVGEPDIEVTVPEPAGPVVPDTVYTQWLTIANVGGADLSWSITETAPVGWLSQDPLTGIVPGGSSQEVALIYDATGLEVGVYDIVMRINSDDPDEWRVYFPVTMTVQVSGCVDVSGVDLSLVTSGSLGLGQEVQFEADVAPDDASKPFSYTLDYGDGTSGVSGSSSVEPLLLTHTYEAAGRYLVAFTAWNCGLTGPVSDTLQVEVMGGGYAVYLPILIEND